MSYVRVCLFILFGLGLFASAEAATATWDRNPETFVTGYLLSYGTQSGVHTVSINVGNVTTYQFFPPAGQRYYVVVQARTSTGALGPKSTEVILDLRSTTNLAPTLQQPANQSSVRNTTVSLTLVGSDPNGTPVTYSASGLPPGLSVNTTTGVISGTVTTTGTYTVTARVSDGSLSATRTFTWTVTAPTTNAAPTLQQPANQSSVRNTAVSLTLVGSDPNGTPITYSATGLPPGLSVNATTGVISGTVTTAGTFAVTARVSDGSLSATRTFTWTVTAPTTNQAPTLQQPANQTSVRNTAVSLTLIGSDPNGTPVTFSATGLPPGLSVNANSGVISGTVTTAGTYTVTARVSDGSLTATRTFTWTVTAGTTSAVTVTLSPTDTTLSIETVNYANDRRLMTMTYPAQRVGMAPVMKFNLSQIPSNATIQSATLQLWLVGADTSTDQTYSVSLHQVINRNPTIAQANGRTYNGVNAWTASSCCSQGAPMAQGDISPARATLAVDKVLGAKTWNALELVRSWHASPATNYGLLLNADRTKTANRFRFFASMEHPTASQRPLLRITYSVPSGTTTTTTTSTTTAMRTTDGGAESTVEMTADPLDELMAQVTETGDQPTRGDFDGDGVSDIATFRSATGEWRTWLSSRNYAASMPVDWGTQGDLQVAADYDGDRRTDFAIYRPATGMWHVMLSSTNGVTTLDVRWGNDRDRPVAFDYDRDGRADLALPRNGNYFVLLSGSNYQNGVIVPQ